MTDRPSCVLVVLEKAAVGSESHVASAGQRARKGVEARANGRKRKQEEKGLHTGSRKIDAAIGRSGDPSSLVLGGGDGGGGREDAQPPLNLLYLCPPENNENKKVMLRLSLPHATCYVLVTKSHFSIHN